MCQVAVRSPRQANAKDSILLAANETKHSLTFIATAILASYVQFTSNLMGVVIDAIFYILASPTRRDLTKPERDSFPRGSVLTIASPEDSLVISELFMSSWRTE